MSLTEQLERQDEREAFIAKYVPLVHRVVKIFLSRYPHLGYLKDDIRSAAYVGLLTATNRLAAGKNVKSIGGYLTVSMRRAIRSAVEREDVLYIPATTKKRRRKEGEELKVGPLQTPLPEASPMTVVFKGSEPAMEQEPLIDLWDELFAACDSEAEKTMLRLKAQGYCDEEIGELFGVHRTTVMRTISEIEKRFYRD